VEKILVVGGGMTPFWMLDLDIRTLTRMTTEKVLADGGLADVKATGHSS
jgi:hypothetical protein